jgi:hypothetical protein
MTVPNPSRSPAETEHITARVETRLLDALRRKAVENDRSLSAELRQALRIYLRDYSHADTIAEREARA